MHGVLLPLILQIDINPKKLYQEYIDVNADKIF